MNPQAILLLGPTGAGKSPLGDWLEKNTFRGRRCHHFDFGENLRAAVASQLAGAFNPEEIRFLRRVLEEGALLEDEYFHLAARIFDGFVARKNVQATDLVVLNGLPRHLQQARALDEKITVVGLVQLDCEAGTVSERLRRNSGGDRAQREDDSEALVARKLAIFEERTRPLLNYYMEQSAAILKVQVGVETRPAEIVAKMQDWQNRL
jgi:adenylate kinase